MVTCQSSELGWKVTVELPADFLSLGRGLSLVPFIVTSQLSNLSLSQSYEGLDDIFIGDGLGLHITHTGSMPFSPFTLTNVLCVPSIHQNLTLVSKF